MENYPKKFFSLPPGSEVRLQCAYILKYNDVNDLVKDDDANMAEIEYD